ncbi:MAG TPA: SDR family oxidoreductase, partial [Gemmatimonadaceae bacterium]|nr:SDR family oxidoreductase [Gemmatimonadaceae bacterium]
AARGCHLALADINAERLADTAALAARDGLRVSVHPLDVSRRAQVTALPDAVLAQHRGVDLLFNIAGVGLGGRYEQVTDDDVAWVMDVNFWGTVWMTRAFLPALRASGAARIVNVSSVFGMVAPAGNVAYSASKFAVRGFSEALRWELEESGIGVTVVHPGGVATNIANDARVPAGVDAVEVERKRVFSNKRLRMPPARAGEIIVRGVEAGRRRVLVGWDAVAISLLTRLMPVRYWSVLRRWVREEPDAAR